MEQLIVIIEERIIKEEEDKFGLFLDGKGHIPRDFLMLNSDERLYRLKYAVMEWVQLDKMKPGFPRLPVQRVSKGALSDATSHLC